MSTIGDPSTVLSTAACQQQPPSPALAQLILQLCSFFLHMHQVCACSQSFSWYSSAPLLFTTCFSYKTQSVDCHHRPASLREYKCCVYVIISSACGSETIRVTKDIFLKEYSPPLCCGKRKHIIILFFPTKNKKEKKKDPSPLKRSGGADVKRGSAVCYRARCCDRRPPAVEWGVKKTLGRRREVFEHLEGSKSEGPA